jgi:hypothetical protein
MNKLDRYLQKYKDKCFNDIRSELTNNKKLDINSIILLTDILNGLEKYIVYKIKTFERSLIINDLEKSKNTDYSKSYKKFKKLESLISRRSIFYTNRQWECWRLYKESNDKKFEEKHFYYESKVNSLSNLKDSLLNRTDWKIFENNKYKEINKIDFKNYLFSEDFINFEMNEPFIIKESDDIYSMIEKI